MGITMERNHKGVKIEGNVCMRESVHKGKDE